MIIFISTSKQQYVPDRCRTAMYWSDLGFGGDPFYKVEVVCSGTGQLSERDRLRFGMQSDFGDESG